MVLSARRTEEVTQEGLNQTLAKLAPAAAPAITRRVPPPDAQELVVSWGIPGGDMPAGMVTVWEVTWWGDGALTHPSQCLSGGP